MIVYEDYDLPCNLLADNDLSAALAFSRSNFEYAPRQRKTFKGYDTSGFSISLNKNELVKWEAFWEDLDYGTDRFQAKFLLHGSNVTKTLRFTDRYFMKNLGAGIFIISCPLEIIYMNNKPYFGDCAAVAYDDCTAVAFPTCY